jgi:hypothetical protein
MNNDEEAIFSEPGDPDFGKHDKANYQPEVSYYTGDLDHDNRVDHKIMHLLADEPMEVQKQVYDKLVKLLQLSDSSRTHHKEEVLRVLDSLRLPGSVQPTDEEWQACKEAIMNMPEDE